ncbi:MAG: serine/threonine-protein kinase [Planctomycetota bacterium]
MTLDRMQKVEELFHQVISLDAKQREALLDEACKRDPSLKRELDSLIAAYEKTSGFFEQPAWSSLVSPETCGASATRAIDAEPGLPFEKLGEFRLIRRLGEGGMGIVFLAMQESLGRVVALKVIRRERMGSMEAQARFTREVEAISGLRHPNIVAVHGSGEEQGVRYFAMEHVPGRGLDEILADARQRNETIAKPKILDWVRSMALALESAHKARILHRDVKPSNMVITPEGRAMLMDFGVARQMNLSALTASGDFRGTPNYASPEQVKARSQTLDARTDIYSLGVTLYEAMTGKVPFEGETTEQVFRKILDQEPPLPRRLNPSISRDLETVILTAMDKDPNQRYASMQAFSDDLDRLVRGEMIMARAAGFPTRAWKRIRRNPVVSAAVAISVAALLCLILYVLWSYPQILRERDNANLQRAAAVAAKAEAEKESRKAQVINEFLETMLASADPGVSGKDVRVADLLDDASRKIAASFQDQPEIEAALRETLGMTYVGLGLFDPALAHLAQSLEIREGLFGKDHDATLASMNGLATVNRRLGRHAEARALYSETLERSRALHGDENPVTLVALHNLALITKDLGQYDEAIALQQKVVNASRKILGDEHPDTLRAKNNLATTYMMTGDFAEAEALLKEVLEIKRRVMGEEHPSTLSTMNNLAVTYKNMKNYSEAEKLQRENLEIQHRVMGEEHPDTLDSTYNLAIMMLEQGKLDEAEALHRKAFDIRRRTLGESHPATRNSMSYLAIIYWTQGRFDDAVPLQKELLALCRKTLGEKHPDTRLAINNLIGILMDQKEYADAEPLLEEIIRIYTAAGTPVGLRKAAEYEVSLGECLTRLSRFDEAESPLLKGYLFFKENAGAEHENTLDAAKKIVQLYEAWGKPEKVADILGSSPEH